MSELYIGLLSGTSMDGIDAALVRFSPQSELVCTAAMPLDPALRSELLSLAQAGDNEIDRMGRADVRLGRAFAAAVKTLLVKAGVEPSRVRAIGSHGQTVRHRPDSDPLFTLQIGDPNVIATETGIPVVSDFRRKDIALGGQGAPLVPAFHDAVFRSKTADRVVVNIGGIANLTALPRGMFSPVLGFDTGPGNGLMDAWCLRHVGQPYDDMGMLAARGRILVDLLDAMLADPYFEKRPPKSTGREYFSLDWLDAHLARIGQPGIADVQATLLALSVHSISNAIRQLPLIRRPEVFVCGGGAHNAALMRTLQIQLPDLSVQSTEALGIHPDWVEAMAFAWLARQRMHEQPGNLPVVTGASRPAVLGSVTLPG